MAPVTPISDAVTIAAVIVAAVAVVIDAVGISAVIADAVVAAGIDWHGVAAIVAAAIVVAGIDWHNVAAIVAAGVNGGDVAVAHRLATRERNGEPSDSRAKENPIANHGPSPCLSDRDGPPCGRTALRLTVVVSADMNRRLGSTLKRTWAQTAALFAAAVYRATASVGEIAFGRPMAQAGVP
jgi:hypothetical protein